MHAARTTIRLRPALALLGFAILLGVWQGSTVLMAMRAEGSTRPWPHPYLWELTGAVAAYLFFWVPLWTVRAAPRAGTSWGRRMGVYLLAFVAFSLPKNMVMIGSRYVLYPRSAGAARAFCRDGGWRGDSPR